MKNKITILLPLVVVILFSSSCTKDKKENQFRSIGYIYNSVDSLPFKNTKFKVYFYKYANLVSKEETKEESFFTDENGYFDVTVNFRGAEAVWPSFHYGAAYIGPPPFDPKRSEQLNEGYLHIAYYDTVYTEPYH